MRVPQTYTALAALCFSCILADIRYLDDATPEDQSGEWLGNEPSCNAQPDDCFLLGFPARRLLGLDDGFSYEFWFDGTTGDAGYCDTGSKVYCGIGDAPWFDYRWKGSGSLCLTGGTTERCKACPRDWECIAQDRSGNGRYCAKGRKVLCVDRLGVGGGNPQIPGGFDGPPVTRRRMTVGLDSMIEKFAYTRLVFGIDLATTPNISDLTREQTVAITRAIGGAFAFSDPPVTARAEGVSLKNVTAVDAALLADIPDEDIAARQQLANFDVLFRVEITFLTEEEAFEALVAASDDSFDDIVRSLLNTDGSVGTVDELIVADPELNEVCRGCRCLLSA